MYVAMHFAAAAQVLLGLELQLSAFSDQLSALSRQRVLTLRPQNEAES
jgi:hypothetical protein